MIPCPAYSMEMRIGLMEMVAPSGQLNSDLFPDLSSPILNQPHPFRDFSGRLD